MSSPDDALGAIGAIGVEAWVVGGAVRDRRLARPTHDLDVVARGDPAALARAVARRAHGHAFRLSEAFGSWRVVARDRGWQLDLQGLGEGPLVADLLRRDLTVNAIAEPLGGGEPVDPAGGLADLAARRLRMVSAQSFVADPLRVLRLARLAAQLGFVVEPGTARTAAASAPGLAAVAPERVFAELRALICAPGALDGLALADALGATAAVLPEVAALRGVEQSAYHHLDVAGHTRAVLAETIALTAEPERLGLEPAATAALGVALDKPLADELTHAQALRLGALLHDIAKPRTRRVTSAGRVTFLGHDEQGGVIAEEVLARLRAAQPLRRHVAALARHHLRLGFLVHERPLAPRAVYDYLDACEPVGVDVTVLSVADRLATRGRGAERAIAAHVSLARELLPAALAFAAEPPRPAIRGDELARALGIAPGRALGPLLAELRAAAYTGEAVTPTQAIERARAWRAAPRSMAGAESTAPADSDGTAPADPDGTAPADAEQ